MAFTITHNGLMIARDGDLENIIGHCYDNPVRGIDGHANARLMAAAPELLGACEAVMALFDDKDSPITPEIYKKVYWAIAKAKGQMKGE